MNSKARSRPKGLPDIGCQHTESDIEDNEEDGLERVTYRLPKLTPRGSESDDEDRKKVWSRYGYEERSTTDLKISPRPAPRGHYNTGAKFESAMIAPVGYKPPSFMYKPSLYKTWDQSLYRRYARLEVADVPVPVSTPIRPISPTGSVRSIHWTLGPNQRTANFDKKGRTRVQGPFSREFTVTCVAPTNWLKMKWGPRSKSMLY